MTNVHKFACPREMGITKTQSGFRGGFGTREAEMTRDVNVCFIDFSTAFDNVKYRKRLNSLKLQI